MRVILHSDLNNFYASCEALLHPEYKGLPLVVCGKIKDRHGVVLAKNYEAKLGGIKTGMTLFECRKIFPNLVAVEANHDLYLEYSKKVKDIYREYTDYVESFGIDEAWLDVTNCMRKYKTGKNLAEIIRKRVKEEIGLTVSIGVSFNKIFAKLGSDLKKPDAVTTITIDNYKQIVWPLAVDSLLMVGRKTLEKLANMGIKTIGGLAGYDKSLLKSQFGKIGEKLWMYANGLDDSLVCKVGSIQEIKSVGNSLTFYRDMYDLEDVERLFYMLSESVSKRIKQYELGYAKTLHIMVVDKNCEHYSVQTALAFPTNCSNDLAKTAIELFKQKVDVLIGIRGVGVCASNFVKQEQLLIGEEQLSREKNTAIDLAIEGLRNRFGYNTLMRATMLKDKRILTMGPSTMPIASNRS